MKPIPVAFQPILKPRVWGGDRLQTILGKELKSNTTNGESWELSDLETDQSVVIEGPASGRTLESLVTEWGPKLLGTTTLATKRFPLLLKFLDARETLSVQVHPDTAMAARSGGAVRVKHEAWYVIGAEPNACIYRGFKNGVTRDDLKHAIDAGTVQQLLNPIPARKGHAFYLPSGTVHALGGGVLAAEVQTPSDTTFRVFDWNRIDPATGQPRDLHIAQALECIHFGPADFPEEHTSHVASVWTAVTTLIRCPHFAMDRVRMVAGVEQAIPLDGFVIWMILEGRCSINGAGMDKPAEFRHGQTVLIPAGLAEARVQTPEPCMWLEITVPQPSSLADYEKPPREDPHAARGFNQGLVRLNVPRSPDPT